MSNQPPNLTIPVEPPPQPPEDGNLATVAAGLSMVYASLALLWLAVVVAIWAVGINVYTGVKVGAIALIVLYITNTLVFVSDLAARFCALSTPDKFGLSNLTLIGLMIHLMGTAAQIGMFFSKDTPIWVPLGLPLVWIVSQVLFQFFLRGLAVNVGDQTSKGRSEILFVLWSLAGLIYTVGMVAVLVSSKAWVIILMACCASVASLIMLGSVTVYFALLGELRQSLMIYQFTGRPIDQEM